MPKTITWTARFSPIEAGCVRKFKTIHEIGAPKSFAVPKFRTSCLLRGILYWSNRKCLGVTTHAVNRDLISVICGSYGFSCCACDSVKK